MLSTILIVIPVLVIIGTIPVYPHSRGWGYYPSGGSFLVLLVVLILLFGSGRL